MAIRNRCSNSKKAFADKLRKNMTKPEKILWKRICSKKLGVWAYAQSVVYGYILDFWVPSKKICIEVDGPHHRKRKAYDKKRDAVLASKGIKTVRFTTKQIEKNISAVVQIIRHKCK